MSLEWPQRMTEGGRLHESDAAYSTGRMLVVDPQMSCPQTLNITLFFDGTNNNDDPANGWRDSLKNTHTNIARLRNVALNDTENGNFRLYVQGVGTPFPDIGEPIYTQNGKALAKGFNERCVWGYAQVLNSVYYAITKSKFRELIVKADLKTFCEKGAYNDLTSMKDAVHRLSVAHKQAFDESRHPSTVRQVWINAIGFSRGAAGARAFVNRLVNEWAPGGNLSEMSGKYAIPYQVNFMGLFDTVASVGLPDSTRSAVDLNMFDGHSGFCAGNGLEIPGSVRFCYHAISIHEQRMSFPLDSIAKGVAYAPNVRREVAYPGVHSDVGGGYAPGEQGKACNERGVGDDSCKLSQIPLHDMYIAALKYGVPLRTQKALVGNEEASHQFSKDFALDSATIATFNSWLKTTEPIDTVGDALRFGMGQLLSWRTLRARVGTGSYVTEQPFFQRATEDKLTPHKVANGVKAAKKSDSQYQELNRQLGNAEGVKSTAMSSARYPDHMAAVTAADNQITALQKSIRERGEALCGRVAYPDADPAKSARPGEGPYDISTNEKTDLLQGAEEMRLLLGYLYPQQREVWQVRQVTIANASPNSYPATAQVTLSVAHTQKDSDSPAMTLGDSGFLFKVVWSALLSQYDPADDVLAAPVSGVVAFLKQHTSEAAVAALQTTANGAIDLYDNYVHDSRCWFRVPYFHEYAPGGYGWPRVYWAGGDKRVRYLGMASDAELNTLPL